MSIEFIIAGLQTSLQDAGRVGYMHNGVSHSGAMDRMSMQLSNWLVAKSGDSALIEITLVGPALKFHSAMAIAICGAQFDITISGKTVSNNETLFVKAGDSLIFGQLRSGARAYLAFSGQPELHPVFNSYATHLTAGFGGFKDRAFKAGDIFKISKVKIPGKRKIPENYQQSYSGNYRLRCANSVETDFFSESQKQQLVSQSYRITADSNRMGVRLQGEPLEFKKEIHITSSGLMQGSIQIPPSGQAIISSVDGQTIGGYPRIASVITADLPILGQLKAKDKISFTWINKSKALQLLKEKQARLQLLFKS